MASVTPATIPLAAIAANGAERSPNYASAAMMPGATNRMANSNSVMIDVNIIWPIASTPAEPGSPTRTQPGKNNASPL